MLLIATYLVAIVISSLSNECFVQNNVIAGDSLPWIVNMTNGTMTVYKPIVTVGSIISDLDILSS